MRISMRLKTIKYCTDENWDFSIIDLIDQDSGRVAIFFYDFKDDPRLRKAVELIQAVLNGRPVDDEILNIPKATEEEDEIPF